MSQGIKCIAICGTNKILTPIGEKVPKVLKIPENAKLN